MLSAPTSRLSRIPRLPITAAAVLALLVSTPGRRGAARTGGLLRPGDQPRLRRRRQLGRHAQRRLHRDLQPWHVGRLARRALAAVRERDRHRRLRGQHDREDRAACGERSRGRLLPRPGGERRQWRCPPDARSHRRDADRDGGSRRQGRAGYRHRHPRLQREQHPVRQRRDRTHHRPGRLRGDELLRDRSHRCPQHRSRTSRARAPAATDTDNNSADFDVADPAPRNGATATAPCGGGTPTDTAPSVASTSPAGGANDVALDSNVTVTFSEDVTVADGWYGLSCNVSGAHTATVVGWPQGLRAQPRQRLRLRRHLHDQRRGRRRQRPGRHRPGAPGRRLLGVVHHARHQPVRRRRSPRSTRSRAPARPARPPARPAAPRVSSPATSRAARA